jgi:hypothetical protein
MANEVNFDLKVAVESFKQSMNQANNSVTSFHNDFKKHASTSSQAFAVFAGGLALGAVKAFGQAVLGSLGSMISEAAKSEEAVNNLNIALKSTGQFSKAASQDLQDFANSIQATTIYEGEAVLASASLIQSLSNLDKEGLKKATKAAVELASTFNMDLNSASMLIGKAAEGNVAAFGKMGITIQKGATDAETFANTLAALEKQQGTAAGKTNTFSGALTQAGTAFGDILETAGLFVTTNPQFVEAIKLSTEGFIKVAEKVKVFGDFLVKYSDFITPFAIGIGLTATAMGAYAIATSAAVASTIAFTAALATNPVGLIALGISAVIGGLILLVKKWDEVKLVILQGVQSILQTLLPLEDAFASVFGIDSGRISGALNSITDSVTLLKNKINEKNAPIVDTAQLEADAKLAKDQAAIRAANEAVAAEERNRLNAVELEAKRIHNQELLLVEQEGILAQNELRTANEVLTVEQRALREQEDLTARQELEASKLQLVIDSENNKAQAEADAEKRRKDFKASADKAELSQLQLMNKNKLDSSKQAQKSIKAVQDQELADRETFLNTASTLAQSSNKTAAAIGKAAALTQIAIQTPKAVASSFAWGSSLGGPAVGFALGAIAAAAMAAQASKVTGVGNFEQGGFIPGRSFSGDKLQANVNSGEAVLNASQQKEFMKIANGGGSSNEYLLEKLDQLTEAIFNRPIVLVANENELARSVSRGVQNGIVIGSSR